MITNSHHEFLF